MTALAVGVVLTLLGLWGLDLQAKQARDTDRKLDLEDLELALIRVLNTTGTVPPADAPTWCGRLTDAAHAAVQEAVEQSLRETKKYQNPAKPFPRDPRWGDTDRDYVYWKTSPVTFELLAQLEADDNNSRPLDLTQCALRGNADRPALRSPASGRDEGGYDYAILSHQRTPL